VRQDRHLAIALASAVPLRILELRQVPAGYLSYLLDAENPGWQDAAAAIVETGDVLLFAGGKRGESAALFNRLADAIALMAFLPGGISLFGQHWEASAAPSPSSG
jgi:hypothetical protein